MWVSAMMRFGTLPPLSIVDQFGSPQEAPRGAWARPAEGDPWGHEPGEDLAGLLSPDGHVKTHAERLALARLLDAPKPAPPHHLLHQHDRHHHHWFGTK